MRGTTPRVGRGVRIAALLALVAALLAGAASPVPTAAAAGGTRYRDLVFGSYTVERDLVYGQSVNHLGQLEQHEVDVYEPAGDPVSSGRAAVVWVHGGYFIEGSKDVPWYQAAIDQYVRSGYVVFSINYRLNPTLPRGLPGVIQTLRLQEYIQEAKDAAHDAQAAVRWVRANAGRFGVDQSKIAVSGHSAGGIISQMVGFNSEDPGTSGTPGVSSKVAAVVSSAGGSLPVVLADVDLLAEPPMLLSHGVVDDVVPYPADLPACVLTVALGNVCEQLLDPDQDHGIFGYAQWREFLYRRMIAPPPLSLPVGIQVVGFPPLFP